MRYETLLLERAGPVAVLVVNRPEKRNALNAQVRSELVAALATLRDAADLRVLVLTGAGDRAFVAGADVAEFATRTPLEQRRAMATPRVFDAVAEFPLPVIAMVNGLALGGGCELALACDLRIAAESAQLGQPEIRLGLIPGGGATQRLPRLVGLGRATRLVLTGEPVGSAAALAMGLVDEVCPDAQLRERTMSIAHALAAHSPVALQLAKAALRSAAELPLQAGLAHERELFVSAFGSADAREGVAAFLEKRAPVFTGR
jgi:enoyl-CoA hydratase